MQPQRRSRHLARQSPQRCPGGRCRNQASPRRCFTPSTLNDKNCISRNLSGLGLVSPWADPVSRAGHGNIRSQWETSGHPPVDLLRVWALLVRFPPSNRLASEAVVSHCPTITSLGFGQRLTTIPTELLGVGRLSQRGGRDRPRPAEADGASPKRPPTKTGGAPQAESLESPPQKKQAPKKQEQKKCLWSTLKSWEKMVGNCAPITQAPSGMKATTG